MIVNVMGQMVGVGEETAKKILLLFWPDGMMDSQAKLSGIVHSYHGEHGLASLSQRQLKETIDIFFQPTAKHPNIAVRVQGKKGSGRMRAEQHQREILEELGVKVVDLYKYECKELFKERLNYLSIWEVADALRRAGVKP